VFCDREDREREGKKEILLLAKIINRERKGRGERKREGERLR